MYICIYLSISIYISKLYLFQQPFLDRDKSIKTKRTLITIAISKNNNIISNNDSNKNDNNDNIKH